MRLGFAATSIIMAYLIHAFSWRVAFYVTGFGSLLWVLLLWYFTYRDVKTAKVQPAADENKIPWEELLKDRTVLGLVLSKFFQDYLYYLFVTWLPAY